MPQMTLYAPDITCEHCIATIGKAVATVEGARFIAGDPDSKAFAIDIASGAVLDRVAAALAAEGYPLGDAPRPGAPAVAPAIASIVAPAGADSAPPTRRSSAPMRARTSRTRAHAAAPPRSSTSTARRRTRRRTPAVATTRWSARTRRSGCAGASATATTSTCRR